MHRDSSNVDDDDIALVQPRSVTIPAALSEDFARQNIEPDRQNIINALTLGTAVLVGLVTIDWLIIPDVYEINVLARIVGGPPVAALAIYVVRRFTQTSAQHKLVGAAFCVWCSLICSSVIMLSASPGAPVYLTANNVILAFAITMMRQTLPVSIAVTVIVVAIETMAAAMASWSSVAVIVATVGGTIMLTIPLLYATVCLNREHRRHFLDQKRDEARLRKIASQRDVLARLAALDELTGLPNRRGLDAALAGDIENAKPNTPICIAMIDIDHFKSFNDRYGHPAGDDALRRVAGALERATSTGARIGRMGGEEFMMSFVGNDPNTLEMIGARLRIAVERLGIAHDHNGERRCVTISIGMAQGFLIGDDLAPLVALADQALYAAKSGGRNRVVLRFQDRNERKDSVA